MAWKDKDKEREYKQRYYLENKEAIDARNKAYADRNKHLQKARGAKYYAANKEKVLARTLKHQKDNPEAGRRYARKQRLRKKYGLSLQDYDDMLASQQGKCAICGVELELMGRSRRAVCVDHDHDTGSVRELLCGACNKGLGSFQDDPTLLCRAAVYITVHKGN